LIGLIANALVKSVNARYYASEPSGASAPPSASEGGLEFTGSAAPPSLVALVPSWLVVLAPLGWGVAQTVIKSLALFH